MIKVCMQDVQKAAGSLQVCAAQSGGCEAALHAMQNIFEDYGCDAVLLVDTANTYNSIKRSLMLENILRLYAHCAYVCVIVTPLMADYLSLKEKS